MAENGVRHRGKTNGRTEKGEKPLQDKDNKLEEFLERESPLTVLIDSSLHVRAIYHIFVVILLILFCETLIYDLVERGKINVGFEVIGHGFGDIGRGFKLWIYEFFVSLSFYPLLVIYGWLGKQSRNFPVLRHATIQMGLLGLVITQLALTTIPVYDLARKHLAIGSSVAVVMEMFRFMMKIVSISVACGPRCVNGKLPLPTFQHYLYFLFAPTLLYRDQYPRTKKIRWGRVLFHFSEVGAIIFYNCFLWENFILPYWSDYGKQGRVEAGIVVRGMFACVLPGVLAFLCGFYSVLHAWLNGWAEMLTFADRLFYEEWWTSSNFSRYYRRWNRVVYSWLRDHIYVPLAPSVGRGLATFLVFAVSAVAHEVVIALSFGFFYPVLLVEFGVLGVLMVPLTASIGPRYPNICNIFMWLTFFVGNGLLWSLYPMEYFARKNCPASPNDSYFIPKSWSCPQVILKPGWTFNNPFRLF